VFVCLIYKAFSEELVLKISKVMFKKRISDDLYHESAAGRYGRDWASSILR
jgi:hypothetical protein